MIFVTGITGFLGGAYLKLIIEDTSHEYALLVRDPKEKELKKKIKGTKHISVFRGSLHHPDIFYREDDLSFLKEKITKIVHLAALYELGAKRELLYRTNVIGTQNIVFLAKNCSHLKKVVYASTIAVAGDHKGPYCEEDFDLGQSFPDSYSETKFHAEKIIRDFARKNTSINFSVLRFGIVIGDSETGRFSKVDGPYYVFKLLNEVKRKFPQIKKLPFIVFPYNEDCKIPLVTVDHTVLAVNEAVKSSGNKHFEVMHVLSAHLPTLKFFLNDYLVHLGIQVEVIALPPHATVKKLLTRLMPFFDIPKEVVNYLFMETQYVILNESKIVAPDYNDYKHHIFKEADIRFGSSKGDR